MRYMKWLVLAIVMGLVSFSSSLLLQEIFGLETRRWFNISAAYMLVVVVVFMSYMTYQLFKKE